MGKLAGVLAPRGGAHDTGHWQRVQHYAGGSQAGPRWGAHTPRGKWGGHTLHMGVSRGHMHHKGVDGWIHFSTNGMDKKMQTDYAKKPF